MFTATPAIATRRHTPVLGSWTARAAAICGATLVLMLLWRAASRQEDHDFSVSGFSYSGATAVSVDSRNAAPAPRAPASSLMPVVVGDTFGPSRAQTPAAPAPAAPAPRAAPPAAAAAEELDDAGKTALAAAAGPMTEKSAYSLGGSPKLVAVERVLLSHPKAIKYLLSNRFVIAGIMHDPVLKANCGDPAKAARFLTDTGATLGISPVMQLLRESTRYPGTTEALATSGLAQSFVDGCPAVGALSHDPPAMKAIASANPALLYLVFDPTVAQAITAGPATSKIYEDVQATGVLSGGP